jgi:EcsC protein family
MSGGGALDTRKGWRERHAMKDQDIEAIRTAVALLENASLAARLTNIVGKPIELIGMALPEGASKVIATATTKGMNAALRVALSTLENRPDAASSLLHKALATASGAIGGSLGLVTAPLELPISTIIMLRSIADIARSEGENLADPDAALSCVQVFALGARAGPADAAESGYFVVRGMLAKSITEAARFITERGIVEEGAPILVRFIAQIAARFGVVVTQKLAAQTLPVVGALGGAAVNYAFIDHFQDVARGHFAIRRLERAYGKETVRAHYERIRDETKPSRSPSDMSVA